VLKHFTGILIIAAVFKQFAVNFGVRKQRKLNKTAKLTGTYGNFTGWRKITSDKLFAELVLSKFLYYSGI
jgi:hypothetical protein